MDVKQADGDIAKSWSVSAKSSPKKPLTICCGGRPLTHAAHATQQDVSPVEYLLISVAACFALSCRAALKNRKLPSIPVEVVATGEKARDTPSRLGRISMTAFFGGGIGDEDAVTVAEDAKHLCTVTNTILGSPDIEVSVRAAS